VKLTARGECLDEDKELRARVHTKDSDFNERSTRGTQRPVEETVRGWTYTGEE